jgi:hypothetical protein
MPRLHSTIPADLRARLEAARLDLLALFRALDQMVLTPREIPQRLLRQLFELDADYVEALWALDQPPGSLDLRAMLRDTLAALEQLPAASLRLRMNLPRRVHPILLTLEPSIRKTLNPREAYNMVPGRNPETVKHTIGSVFGIRKSVPGTPAVASANSHSLPFSTQGSTGE